MHQVLESMVGIICAEVQAIVVDDILLGYKNFLKYDPDTLLFNGFIYDLEDNFSTFQYITSNAALPYGVVPTVTTSTGFLSAKYDVENDAWIPHFVVTDGASAAFNSNVVVPYGTMAIGFANAVSGDGLSVAGNATVTGTINSGAIQCGDVMSSGAVNAYRVSATNVGIGTNNPSARLEVAVNDYGSFQPLNIVNTSQNKVVMSCDASGNLSANSVTNAQDLSRAWLPAGTLVASNIVQSCDQGFNAFYHNGGNQACTEYSVGICQDPPAYNLHVGGYTGTYSLHMTGGYISSDTFIGFHVLRTSAVTTPSINSILTGTHYNSAVSNSGLWKSTTGYITAPLAGYYQISVSVTAATASAAITIRKNTTTAAGGIVVAGASSTTASGTSTTVSALVQMAAGNTLSVWTGAVSMSVGQYNTLSCYLVMASSLVL
jgi:hypothetical protein